MRGMLEGRQSTNEALLCCKLSATLQYSYLQIFKTGEPIYSEQCTHAAINQFQVSERTQSAEISRHRTKGDRVFISVELHCRQPRTIKQRCWKA